ncbi:hypothetical protein CEUSTIGMA_g3902.t1 [Chlamydomonas eustigma]|uniref:Uncharacterized protein n=1 Tax=Chlamydomonas eustigma TaxID=1157962 RepID=A0A250X061_9CHLO|nr:hypothetical protein CEUSTIGMA_g3902.t1 [Chlamydomonas eustigma]|eukprot:GAX76457.1 hypothetical protein CEUSTIGMA_g3902.t1 [Chlamydomonas eustigma]
MATEGQRILAFTSSKISDNFKTTQPQLKRKSQLLSEDLHAQHVILSDGTTGEGLNLGHHHPGTLASDHTSGGILLTEETSAADPPAHVSKPDTVYPHGQSNMMRLTSNHHETCQALQQKVPVPSSADTAVLQLHPGADWMKAQQRISDLRVSLEASQIFNMDMQNQVQGLAYSLQAKHEESTFLSLKLSEAQRSLDLIQSSWQGDLTEIQGSMVLELQEELSSRTRHSLSLQAELQALQFRVQQGDSQRRGEAQAEISERARLTSELGQARLLVAARGRELEAALSAAETTRMTVNREVAVREEQLQIQRLQLEQAVQKLASADSDALGHHQASKSCQEELKKTLVHNEELKAQVAQLQAEVADMRLQAEWVEGALTDCGVHSEGSFWKLGNQMQPGAVPQICQEDHERAVRDLQSLKEELGRVSRQYAEEKRQGVQDRETWQQQCQSWLYRQEELEAEVQRLASSEQQAQHAILSLRQSRLEAAEAQQSRLEAAEAHVSSAGAQNLHYHHHPAQQPLSSVVVTNKGLHPAATSSVTITDQQHVGNPPAALSTNQWTTALGMDSSDDEGEPTRGGSPTAMASSLLAIRYYDGGGKDSPLSLCTADASMQTDDTPFLHAEGQDEQRHQETMNGSSISISSSSRGAGNSPSSSCIDAPAAPQHVQAMALLDVAKEEIQRLKDINQRLVDSRGPGGPRMVPVEDVKKALADVRHSGRMKLEEAVEACSQAWATRLSTVESRFEEEQAELLTARLRLSECMEEVQSLRKVSSEVKARLAMSEAEVSEARYAAKTASSTYQKLLQDATASLTTLEVKLEEAVGCQQEAESRSKSLAQEVELLSTRMEEAQNKLQSWEDQNSQLEVTLREKVKEAGSAQARVDAAEQKLLDFQSKLAEKSAAAAALIASLSEKEAMIEELKLSISTGTAMHKEEICVTRTESERKEVENQGLIQELRMSKMNMATLKIEFEERGAMLEGVIAEGTSLREKLLEEVTSECRARSATDLKMLRSEIEGILMLDSVNGPRHHLNSIGCSSNTSSPRQKQVDNGLLGDHCSRLHNISGLHGSVDQEATSPIGECHLRGAVVCTAYSTAAAAAAAEGAQAVTSTPTIEREHWWLSLCQRLRHLMYHDACTRQALDEARAQVAQQQVAIDDLKEKLLLANVDVRHDNQLCSTSESAGPSVESRRVVELECELAEALSRLTALQQATLIQVEVVVSKQEQQLQEFHDKEADSSTLCDHVPAVQAVQQSAVDKASQSYHNAHDGTESSTICSQGRTTWDSSFYDELHPSCRHDDHHDKSNTLAMDSDTRLYNSRLEAVQLELSAAGQALQEAMRERDAAEAGRRHVEAELKLQVEALQEAMRERDVADSGREQAEADLKLQGEHTTQLAAALTEKLLDLTSLIEDQQVRVAEAEQAGAAASARATEADAAAAAAEQHTQALEARLLMIAAASTAAAASSSHCDRAAVEENSGQEFAASAGIIAPSTVVPILQLKAGTIIPRCSTSYLTLPAAASNPRILTAPLIDSTNLLSLRSTANHRQQQQYSGSQDLLASSVSTAAKKGSKQMKGLKAEDYVNQMKQRAVLLSEQPAAIMRRASGPAEDQQQQQQEPHHWAHYSHQVMLPQQNLVLHGSINNGHYYDGLASSSSLLHPHPTAGVVGMGGSGGSTLINSSRPITSSKPDEGANSSLNPYMTSHYYTSIAAPRNGSSSSRRRTSQKVLAAMNALSLSMDDTLHAAFSSSLSSAVQALKPAAASAAIPGTVVVDNATASKAGPVLNAPPATGSSTEWQAAEVRDKAWQRRSMPETQLMAALSNNDPSVVSSTTAGAAAHNAHTSHQQVKASHQLLLNRQQPRKYSSRESVIVENLPPPPPPQLPSSCSSPPRTRPPRQRRATVDISLADLSALGTSFIVPHMLLAAASRQEDSRSHAMN